MSGHNNKNNKNNNKNNPRMKGILTLVAWAVVLTVVLNYMSAYSGNAANSASSHEVRYSQFIDLVEAWNSAGLSRCPRGERPLVELYLEPGGLFRTMHGRVTAPSC